MKKYLVDFLLGAGLSFVSFLTLVLVKYDNQWIETFAGIVVFFVYTKTSLYADHHGVSSKELFYSFLMFLLGISVAYLVLWIVLVVVLMVLGRPTLLI